MTTTHNKDNDNTLESDPSFIQYINNYGNDFTKFKNLESEEEQKRKKILQNSYEKYFNLKASFVNKKEEESNIFQLQSIFRNSTEESFRGLAIVNGKRQIHTVVGLRKEDYRLPFLLKDLEFRLKQQLSYIKEIYSQMIDKEIISLGFLESDMILETGESNKNEDSKVEVNKFLPSNFLDLRRENDNNNKVLENTKNNKIESNKVIDDSIIIEKSEIIEKSKMEINKVIEKSKVETNKVIEKSKIESNKTEIREPSSTTSSIEILGNKSIDNSIIDPFNNLINKTPSTNTSTSSVSANNKPINSNSNSAVNPTSSNITNSQPNAKPVNNIPTTTGTVAKSINNSPSIKIPTNNQPNASTAKSTSNTTAKPNTQPIGNTVAKPSSQPISSTPPGKTPVNTQPIAQPISNTIAKPASGSPATKTQTNSQPIGSTPPTSNTTAKPTSQPIGNTTAKPVSSSPASKTSTNSQPTSKTPVNTQPNTQPIGNTTAKPNSQPISSSPPNKNISSSQPIGNTVSKTNSPASKNIPNSQSINTQPSSQSNTQPKTVESQPPINLLADSPSKVINISNKENSSLNSMALLTQYEDFNKELLINKQKMDQNSINSSSRNGLLKMHKSNEEVKEVKEKVEAPSIAFYLTKSRY